MIVIIFSIMILASVYFKFLPDDLFALYLFSITLYVFHCSYLLACRGGKALFAQLFPEEAKVVPAEELKHAFSDTFSSEGSVSDDQVVQSVESPPLDIDVVEVSMSRHSDQSAPPCTDPLVSASVSVSDAKSSEVNINSISSSYDKNILSSSAS